MGTHMRVLGEGYLMNTNMTEFRWFFKNLCIIALWTKVDLALEGLKQKKTITARIVSCTLSE